MGSITQKDRTSARSQKGRSRQNLSELATRANFCGESNPTHIQILARGTNTSLKLVNKDGWATASFRDIPSCHRTSSDLVCREPLAHCANAPLIIHDSRARPRSRTTCGVAAECARKSADTGRKTLI